MSKTALNSYLRSLEKELLKKSKTYRTAVSDKRSHHFRFTVKDLVKQTLVELNDHRDLNFTEAEITPLVKNILVSLRTQANRMKARGVTGVVRTNQHFIYVHLITGVNPRTSKGFNIFSRLKTIYRAALNRYVRELNELAATKGVQIKKFKNIDENNRINFSDQNVRLGSDLFEGGHEKEAGVLETRIRDVVEDANAAFMTKQDNLSRADIMNDLALLGIDLSIMRNDVDDSHTIFVESKIQNRLDGLASADAKDRLLKDIRFAIMKLPAGRGLENLSGSDSISTKKRKKLGKKVTKPFKKIKSKNVTVKTEDFTIKSNSSSTKTKKKPKKSIAKNAAIRGLKKPKSAGRAAKSTTSLTHLVPLLNQKLPEVVAANMGDPRLNNVSGRFAASVRVTEISRTTQGFPSIGYTYQRSPYQTFEQGNKQGSRDRDPRSLIDTSIREVAVQYALGRFYTRRV